VIQEKTTEDGRRIFYVEVDGNLTPEEIKDLLDIAVKERNELHAPKEKQ
jgi:hypothetical protein